MILDNRQWNILFKSNIFTHTEINYNNLKQSAEKGILVYIYYTIVIQNWFFTMPFPYQIWLLTCSPFRKWWSYVLEVSWNIMTDAQVWSRIWWLFRHIWSHLWCCEGSCYLLLLVSHLFPCFYLSIRILNYCVCLEGWRFCILSFVSRQQEAEPKNKTNFIKRVCWYIWMVAKWSKTEV